MSLFIRPRVAVVRPFVLLAFITILLPTLSATASGQDKELKSTVTTAAERLAKQSYHWETRVSSVEVGTPDSQVSRVVTSGHQGRSGYVHVDGMLSNADAEFVTKGGKAAVLSDGNWMTLEQAQARSGRSRERGRGGSGFGGRGQSLSEAIHEFQTPAAKAIALVESASGFQTAGDTITASLKSEVATALFNSANAGFGGRGRGRGGFRFGRGRGTGRAGARGQSRGRQGAFRGRGRGNFPQPIVKVTGSVAYTISDDVLTSVNVSLQATETLREEVMRTNREMVTHLSKTSATEFELALDARDIVDALIAGDKPAVFVPEPGFRRLFNGRDLSGWAGREGFWTVEDGALVGRTTVDHAAAGNSSLIARDGDDDLVVDDFELRLSYRLTPSNTSGVANSGIQYRGQDRGDFVVAGYEAAIASVDHESGVLHDKASGRENMAAQGEVVYWNADGQKEVISRLGKADAIQASIKKNDWNEYTIIATENRVQHFVNGVPIVDVTDADKSHQLAAGVLALALPAGQPMTVALKDIRIRPISPIAEAAAAVLEVADGFQIEQIYQVPRGAEGSWVASCFDDRGRLIVSDQRGELYRFEVPAIGQRTSIEPKPIGLGMGGAHGLLHAFDSLYSMGNGPQGTGLYRIRDTDGDDQYDEARLLRAMRVGSDHSAHVAVLSPDGESLYIVSGNQTGLTEVDVSRVPENLSEDHLLPRLDTGFMGGTPAPGGWIARTDPNGEKWEFFASGFRNEFDAAFNRDGELFTYDADMEWDVGAPWYRPTRVNHVISGADFGWRNGAGKHPDYFFDTFGSVVDIGTGSPTGVTFGYGAKFPAKYQQALFISDWSFGKVYAVHLTPDGATYTGEFEEFVAGQPLPVTDVIINHNDGALYLTVGGRATQSAVYRITYVGDESTEPGTGPTLTEADALAGEARAVRRSLEKYHGHADSAAVAAAWPHLGSQDRAIRHAARVALEWQPIAEWRERALSETTARTAIAALAALARASNQDEFHREADDSAPDPALQGQILAALDRIDWNTIRRDDRIDLLRAYQLVFTRLGSPDEATRKALAAKFAALFPAQIREVNFLLSNLLVYLEAPSAATKLMAQIRQSQSQEEQVDYALALRVLRSGWTPPLREEYFRWFDERAGSFRGGNSFNNALRSIQSEAASMLNEEEYAALASIIEAPPQQSSPQELLAARPVVREWTLDELIPLVETGLRAGRRNYAQGRRSFAAVACAACHRFANEGGAIGPDLTNVVGRFSVHDLLESVVHPNKVISDQYGAVTIATTDGRVITGRIGNMNGNRINVVEDMFNAGRLTGINRDDVESIQRSPVSMMPKGLLNTLTAEQIQDLVAYLYSRGSPDHKMFQTAASN